jgi:hypothetical protein
LCVFGKDKFRRTSWKTYKKATDAGSGVGDLLAHVIENQKKRDIKKAGYFPSLANQSSQCLEAA